MKQRPSDRHQTNLGPAVCTTQQHQAAWEVIKSFVAAGLIQPVEDFEGDTAEAYAEILGIEHD